MLSSGGGGGGEDGRQEMTSGDKFFSRLLSKDVSAANPSFRVYYGGAGAVPFLWESSPGTPKHAAATAAPLPLAPPPSYYFAAAPLDGSAPKTQLESSLRRSDSRKIITELDSKRAQLSQTDPKSLPKSPKRKLIHAILPRLALRRIPGGRTPPPSVSSSSGRSSLEEEDNDEARMSPTSTLCFGERLALKKTLLCIVGHGGSA